MSVDETAVRPVRSDNGLGEMVVAMANDAPPDRRFLAASGSENPHIGTRYSLIYVAETLKVPISERLTEKEVK